MWAALDRDQGRAAIKSFVVERSNPGMKLDRLEHKLGIRASDTAAFILSDCRVPKENLLGSPEIDAKKSFAGAMQTFDNTRPLVAAMAVGLTRACLEHTRDVLSQAGSPIVHREQHARHGQVRVELALDERQGVKQSGEALEGEVFSLYGHDDPISSDQREPSASSVRANAQNW